MTTVLLILGAAVCFLLALRCLFTRVPDDPPQRTPDALDKGAYQLIFRSNPPPARSTNSNVMLARVIGFLLFGGLGAGLLVSALR